VGFLELGDLAAGEFRHLRPEEVERFRRLRSRKAMTQERGALRKVSGG